MKTIEAEQLQEAPRLEKDVVQRIDKTDSDMKYVLGQAGEIEAGGIELQEGPGDASERRFRTPERNPALKISGQGESEVERLRQDIYSKTGPGYGSRRRFLRRA